MVALTIIGAASAYGYVNWRFGQIHTKHLSALTTKGPNSAGSGGGKAFTLLVVGSDSRAALDANGDASQFGNSASVSGQRSDTIILVRVVPKTRQVMMLSIPRDLWGPIPGQGSNRINTAFDTGANVLIQTIHQDLGVPINHYVEVNFDTFRDISDAVGGINFYFPTAAKDTLSNLSIPAAGCYSLKGDQALAFVRSRHYEYYQDGYWHYEGLSDLARIQRQQAFIRKMIKKAEGEYTNPFALNAIIGGITKNLTVDSGFSPSLMLTLATDFRSMDVAGIPNLTLPTYGYTTAGGAEVLGLQQPQASQAIAAFNAFGNAAPEARAPSGQPPHHHPACGHGGPRQREHRGGQWHRHGRAGRPDDAGPGRPRLPERRDGVPRVRPRHDRGPLRPGFAPRRQAGGGPDPGRRHPGGGARSQTHPLQPRGRHRVQLHRLDGGRFGLVGCVRPVDELDRHHPAGHQQRCVSAARRPGGPGGAALLTSPLRPLQRGQIERQVLLAY